jgi:undecaprenyl-diphosphatase
VTALVVGLLGRNLISGSLPGLDRVTATKMSFFLSIPALVAAGAYEGLTAASDISARVGWAATIVATVVSFVVAYAAIAWLLRFVARSCWPST